MIELPDRTDGPRVAAGRSQAHATGHPSRQIQIWQMHD